MQLLFVKVFLRMDSVCVHLLVREMVSLNLWEKAYAQFLMIDTW